MDEDLIRITIEGALSKFGTKVLVACKDNNSAYPDYKVAAKELKQRLEELYNV